MSSPFDATASLLGYVFQIRMALLEALVRLRSTPQFLVRLETLDDVSFEDGVATDVLQFKHHVKRAASLTDSCPDLWKTLRVWMSGRADGSIPDDALMFLVTTATAGSGSAAAYLRAGEGRDETRAHKILRAAASTSSDQSTEAARSQFAALSEVEQLALLAGAVVVDQHVTIDRLDERFHAELIHAADGNRVAALTTRLEGWWLRRAVQHLTAGDRSPILSQEILATMADLRDQFRRDNLPIDQDLLDLENFQEAAHADRPFVEQLRLADVNPRRILFAMRDYFRAFEQRSRWIREDLLLVGEVGPYERRLEEEWERRFEQMKTDLDPAAADLEKRRLAERLYRWVENEANVPVRRDCVEAFVTRGSLHLLSDGGRVGWHPEFRDRLRHLFEGAR